MALFDAGIKLGALYQQFIGTPVSLETAETLEKAIEESSSLQPFVEKISVRIDREKLKERINPFGYAELSGEMLSVRLEVRVKNSLVIASLSWDEKLGYPLMKVESVHEG